MDEAANGLKAIETIYDGFRFTSRLEARWAVFFNALGVKYEYETEGYDLDGIWYLPDFWLPELEIWLEVKGPPIVPGDEAWEKAERLAAAAEIGVYVFCGQFPSRAGNLMGRRFDPYAKYLSEEMRTPPEFVWWFLCDVCRRYQPGPNPTSLPCGCFEGPDGNQAVVSAVLAARQARFERPRR